MKFMMLMIPSVYQGGKPAPDFKPDLKAMEAMGRFNEEMGKALKIESLNGLHPQVNGARVTFANGKPAVTDTVRSSNRKKCWVVTGCWKPHPRRKW